MRGSNQNYIQNNFNYMKVSIEKKGKIVIKLLLSCA